MIKEKFILAAGTTGFSRKLAAIFQSEGWQAGTITNEHDAVNISQEMRDVPKYFVADVIRGWVVQLAQELHQQGTEIILSGFMTESHEELEAILGTPFQSIMGLPSKVATVLLGKEVMEKDRVRTRQCERIVGGLNRGFVRRLGIDAIIDPIKRGFSESQGSWMGYIREPAEDVKLVSFMYDRVPESALSVKEYTKMMDGLIDALVYQNARVIATFPLYLTDEDGKELTRSQDDATVMAYLNDWLERHPDKDVRLLYIDGYTPRN